MNVAADNQVVAGSLNDFVNVKLSGNRTTQIKSSYKDLCDMVLDRNYNRGFLRLSDDGELSFAGRHKNFFLKMFNSSPDPNQYAQTREAVYKILCRQFSAGASDEMKNKLAAVKQFLIGDGDVAKNEILLRNEVRAIIMLLRGEMDGAGKYGNLRPLEIKGGKYADYLAAVHTAATGQAEEANARHNLKSEGAIDLRRESYEDLLLTSEDKTSAPSGTYPKFQVREMEKADEKKLKAEADRFFKDFEEVSDAVRKLGEGNQLGQENANTLRLKARAKKIILSLRESSSQADVGGQIYNQAEDEQAQYEQAQYGQNAGDLVDGDKWLRSLHTRWAKVKYNPDEWSGIKAFFTDYREKYLNRSSAQHGSMIVENNTNTRVTLSDVAKQNYVKSHALLRYLDETLYAEDNAHYMKFLLSHTNEHEMLAGPACVLANIVRRLRVEGVDRPVAAGSDEIVPGDEYSKEMAYRIEDIMAKLVYHSEQEFRSDFADPLARRRPVEAMLRDQGVKEDKLDDEVNKYLHDTYINEHLGDKKLFSLGDFAITSNYNLMLYNKGAQLQPGKIFRMTLPSGHVVDARIRRHLSYDDILNELRKEAAKGKKIGSEGRWLMMMDKYQFGGLELELPEYKIQSLEFEQTIPKSTVRIAFSERDAEAYKLYTESEEHWRSIDSQNISKVDDVPTAYAVEEFKTALANLGFVRNDVVITETESKDPVKRSLYCMTDSKTTRYQRPDRKWEIKLETKRSYLGAYTVGDDPTRRLTIGRHEYQLPNN